MILRGALDLIDTQWNVNYMAKTALKLTSGFNRYIVECKFKEDRKRSGRSGRFNRYIVECKLNK